MNEEVGNIMVTGLIIVPMAYALGTAVVAGIVGGALILAALFTLARR